MAQKNERAAQSSSVMQQFFVRVLNGGVCTIYVAQKKQQNNVTLFFLEGCVYVYFFSSI